MAQDMNEPTMVTGNLPVQLARRTRTVLSLSSLRARICVAAVLCAVVSLAATCAAIVQQGRSMAQDAAIENISLTASLAARRVEGSLRQRLQALETLSIALARLKTDGRGLDRSELDAVLRSTLEANPDWPAVYSVWEPNAFDGLDTRYAGKPGSDSSGRYITALDRLSGPIRTEAITGYDSPAENAWYEIPKRTLKPLLVEPFFYPLAGKQVWETTLVVPVVIDGHFAGIVGADYTLDGGGQALASIIDTPGSRVSLISAEGIYVSNADSTLVGKKASDNSIEARRALDSGRVYHAVDAGMINVVAPLRIRDDAAPWRLQISYPAALAEARATQLMRSSIAIGTACAALVGFIMVWVVTMVMRPLTNMVMVVEGLAAGDSSLRVTIAAEGKDELARIASAFNSFIQKLGDAFSDVRDASVGVDTAAGEIFAGNLDLSQRTEQQAASLAQIASTMEDMGKGVRANAEACRGASALTEEVTATANRSAATAGNAVAAMNEVQTISKRIADITSVIDGLAFQTNLLALNAAVEAARAGAHGRGFSVVASEVRTLATRSADAARDIRVLIEQSLVSVSQGSELIRETGRVVGELVGAVERVSSQVQMIDLATQRQANGLVDVVHSVSQLDTVTQQNAALVEEAAAATASLRRQTSRVSTTISAFI
jgi:methyl-accepting chemotaxis protein